MSHRMENLVSGPAGDGHEGREQMLAALVL